MPLKVLGPITSITKSGLVITRIEDYKNIPRIGSFVFDANGEKIGILIDIIGPINNPYAVIRVERKAILPSLKPSMVLFYKYEKEKKIKTPR